MNFNFHYPVGKDVRYAAKTHGVRSLQGDLVIDARTDYCWMWLNNGAIAAMLSVFLTQK